jgi:PIN domain nuclease of toxin-antitoxin system
MTSLLVDTHVAIWWLAGDVQLSESTRELIADADDVRLSVVSLWEVVIKVGKGSLEMPSGYVDALLDDFDSLDLRLDHVLEARLLPPVHRDPFDRMLVAQAMVERLTIVTRDPHIPRYPVPVIAA